jgi:hypothetical protein
MMQDWGKSYRYIFLEQIRREKRERALIRIFATLAVLYFGGHIAYAMYIR